MLFYMDLLLLVIAVSLDGFGVGVTYGMQKTKVPLSALLIIMLCSGVIVLLSMTFGDILNSFISPDSAEIFGGLILILLRLFSLFNIVRSKVSLKKDNEISSNLHRFKKVLSTPDQADLHQSGNISTGEAFMLGTALALDAFGAGLGAAIIGYSPLLTAVSVAFMSGAFLFCGIQMGMLLLRNKHMQKLSFLPPILLISLGVFNML